jgi:hypothetical protein
VQRVGEHLLGGGGLDDAAGVHHEHPVADVGQHRQVVADDQQPDAEVADQVAQQVEDLRLHHHVEGRGRLVGHDQPGAAGQRHRDHHPLLLAAGQLVRVAPRPVGAQPDLLEELRDPPLHGVLAQRRLVDLDRLGDLPADPVHGVERVQGPLEHDRRAGPPKRAQVAPAHGPDVLAEHLDLALDLGVLRLQPEHGRDQRGLAAAGLAGNPHDLALVHDEVYAAYGGQPALGGPVGDVQVAHRQQLGRGCGRRRRCRRRGRGHQRSRSRGLKTSSRA